MNRWHFLVSVGAIAVFGFLLSQDSLARLALQKFGRPDVALALNRGDANLAMYLGNYYFNGTLGKSEYNLKKAERSFKKSVEIDPKILWGHYQLSRIYFVKGDYQKALEEINAELEANSGNVRSLYVRGLIYGYRSWPGDLEKAASDFQRFTQWAPKEWAGYNDRAWILSKQGKYHGAKIVIHEAFREVSRAGENPWLWNSLGVAQLNMREYGAARKSFENAQALANNLTMTDWQRVYPGNHPDQAVSGLQAFRESIAENLRRVSIVDK